MSRVSVSGLPYAATAMAALFAFSGCGEDSDCPARACVTTYSEVETEAGLYHLELVPDAEPHAGAMALDLSVTTVEQRVSVGQTTSVTVSLWMPAHGHGMGEEAITQYLEDGHFRVSWTFPMSGYWEQTIEIDGTGGSDYAVVGYQVQ